MLHNLRLIIKRQPYSELPQSGTRDKTHLFFCPNVLIWSEDIQPVHLSKTSFFVSV